MLVSSSQNPAKAPRKMGTPGSVLHDNARPHSSKTTQTLASLGSTVLPHPPYSPHLAPSDYALFNKITEPLHRRKFPTSDDMERGVCNYTDAVRKLPEGYRAQTLGGVCQKCYSVICHQSSAGDLWPSWVSIFYEWPSYLIWWWFYVHHTCYATSIKMYTDSPYSPLPKQCSFTLTMTNFNDHRYNEHSMDSRLLCLHWQPPVRLPVLGLMPRTGAPETGNWVSGHWSSYAYETWLGPLYSKHLSLF